MANPQLENGFIKIANELYEAFARIRIPGEARQVMDVIIRKTYGFNKTNDDISLSQFVNSTGLSRSIICRGLAKLRLLNLIICKKATGDITNYKINKDFDTWKPLAKKRRGVAKKQIEISKKANSPLYTKDTTTKDNKNNSVQLAKKITQKDIEKFVDLYHKRCPAGSRVEVLTDIRKTHIRSILKKYPDPQFWNDLFTKIMQSPFLRGEIAPRAENGHKQFKLTIDFIYKDQNIAKILEGNYAGTDKARKLTWLEKQRASEGGDQAGDTEEKGFKSNQV